MFETVGIWFSEKILGGILGIFSSKSSRKTELKRHLGEELIKIYTEGSHKNWKVLPRNEEHISYIANEVEGLDKEVANNFRSMAGKWKLIALAYDNHASLKITFLSREDTDYYMNLIKETNLLGEKVLKIAHKWLS